MSLVPSSTPLTHFKLLSFDVYGTLLDWESGAYNALLSSAPIARLPSDHPLRDRTTALQTFENLERPIQVKNPCLEYSLLLSEVYKSICKDQNVEVQDDELEKEAEKFGNSVGDWPAFPDTVEALRRLKKHYYLVPLTNASQKTFGASLAGPFAGFDFSAYHTAGDIGSYKPDLRNFDYLFRKCKEDFGVEKGQILHVAQSLHHDHEPASKIGLESCWVDRNGVMGTVDKETTAAKFGWEVKSLGELAGLVDEAFAKENGGSK
jgi:2-haloalkanoic acid dehalogenase type II